jgi:hypothetical protein
MAGTDQLDACKLVLDELASFPHLPQLPERGPGADAVGRSAALLVDLHSEVVTGRWRLVARPTPEERRARALLSRDLDAFELAAGDYQGLVKVQLLGPWTLARFLELPGGEWSVADPSAVRDIAASLAEGVAGHVEEMKRRLPGVEHVVAELDESLLAAVLAGEVPTASGWGRYPTVEEPFALEVEAMVLDAAGEAAGVRFDGSRAPLGLARRAGARFLALGPQNMGPETEDDLGEALESGLGLLAGLVPLNDHEGAAELDELAAPARRLWRRLGQDFGRLSQTIVVTPSAGLETVGPDRAAAVLRRCSQLAAHLAEEPEGRASDAP